MLTDLVPLLLALLAGLGLGVTYFGGLWVTVVRLPAARRPVLLLVGSLVGRTALLLAGIGLVIGLTGPRWESPLACLAGIILVRQILTRWHRQPASSMDGGSHASLA